MNSRRARIISFVIGSAVLALLVSGALFEGLASKIDARGAPGSFVDVGGRRLHYLCIGSGAPTVIFEPSSGGRSVSFSEARLALAATTRVCSYDRMGTGWSDPGPNSVSVGMLADDLRWLQDAANLTPPFVVVASSIGGAVGEMFARRYPDRVAGLVMLDAANGEALGGLVSVVDATTQSEIQAMCGFIRVASPLGIVRLLAGAPGRWNTLCAIVRGMPGTLKEFEGAPALRADLPIVVLTAATMDGILPSGPLVPSRFEKLEALKDFRPRLTAANQHLAQRSTRGSWRVVPGSGHLIASDRPQAVVDAVREVLMDVRGR